MNDTNTKPQLWEVWRCYKNKASWDMSINPGDLYLILDPDNLLAVPILRNINAKKLYNTHSICIGSEEVDEDSRLCALFSEIVKLSPEVLQEKLCMVHIIDAIRIQTAVIDYSKNVNRVLSSMTGRNKSTVVEESSNHESSSETDFTHLFS